jgi:hypothetical protein
VLVALGIEPQPVLVGQADVPLLRWPVERVAAASREAAGLPFLLLVPHDESPPVSGYRFMDWVRSPVDPGELVARRESLEARFLQSSGGPCPQFDDEALRLSFGPATVDVASSQAVVLRILLDEYREIVPIIEVREAFGLADDDPEELLASRVVRLRRVVRALGLDITRVRGVGFALEPKRTTAPRAKRVR